MGGGVIERVKRIDCGIFWFNLQIFGQFLMGII